MKYNNLHLLNLAFFAFILVNLVTGNSFSQSKKEINSLKYNISHSIGYGFSGEELTFYLSASRTVSGKFSLGIKGGVYNYSENTANKIIDTFIAPIYSSLSAGRYAVNISKMTVKGTTYIGSVYGGFHGFSNIIFYTSFGYQAYKEYDYSLTVYFDKYSQNQPMPKPEDLYLDELEPSVTRLLIKPYVSIGADYRIGLFNFGIYADNIYSAGLNIGVSF